MIGVTSGQRSGVKPWVQKATILRKHQTHLQDSGSEKSGENKKERRNNLGIIKNVYWKPPSIYPNFIGMCIMWKELNTHNITGTILTKVPHIRRPKRGEIIKLEEVGKSEIFLTYIRSALVAID